MAKKNKFRTVRLDKSYSQVRNSYRQCRKSGSVFNKGSQDNNRSNSPDTYVDTRWRTGSESESSYSSEDEKHSESHETNVNLNDLVYDKNKDPSKMSESEKAYAAQCKR